MIGATNEKPRLREQPGFSSSRLRELILPNHAPLERACGDDIQAQTASGDDDVSRSQTGICSDFYVWPIHFTLVATTGCVSIMVNTFRAFELCNPC